MSLHLTQFRTVLFHLFVVYTKNYKEVFGLKETVFKRGSSVFFFSLFGPVEKQAFCLNLFRRRPKVWENTRDF